MIILLVVTTGTRIPDPPPLFPHLVPPAIMVCFLSKTAAGPRNKS